MYYYAAAASQSLSNFYFELFFPPSLMSVCAWIDHLQNGFSLLSLVSS